jgi:hypothetical protein
MDPDPALRRIERFALGWCAAVAVAAFALRPGQPALPLGVLGGGLLVGVSYWAIKAGVDGLVAALAPSPPDTIPDAEGAAGRPADGGRIAGQVAWAMAKLIVRHALLAFLAYVMIARLRLHPIGLLAGVSSVVAGAGFEALRSLARTPR